MSNTLKKHLITAFSVLSVLACFLPFVKVNVDTEFFSVSDSSSLFSVIRDEFSFTILLLFLLPITQIVINYVLNSTYKRYILIGIPVLCLVLTITDLSNFADLSLAESKPAIGFFIAIISYIGSGVFAFLQKETDKALSEKNSSEQVGNQLSNLATKGIELAKNAASTIANRENDSMSTESRELLDTPEKKSIRREIETIDIQLNKLYASIGKQFAEHSLNATENKLELSKELDNISRLITRHQELEQRMIDIDKQAINDRIVKEKMIAQQQFEAEIAKLKNAISMGIMSEDEYNTKYLALTKRMDCFDDIKRYEIQAELGIISNAERDAKINALLNN